MAAPALASNFSYNAIDVSLGVMRLDESLYFDGEIYKEFGTFALSGSFQLNENLALGIGVGVLANEGPDTEISANAVTLSLAFPFAVSRTLDLVPTIGLVSTEQEMCTHSFCYKDDDSGIGYGVGLRLWALPETLEIMAGISDSTLEGSQALVSVGAALWWQNHHSVRLNYSADKDASEVALGYRFSW